MIWLGIALAVCAVIAYIMREHASDRDGYKAMNFMFKLLVSGAIACIGLGVIFAYLSHIGIDVVKYRGLIVLALILILFNNIRN